jgi:hypothetical protein
MSHPVQHRLFAATSTPPPVSAPHAIELYQQLAATAQAKLRDNITPSREEIKAIRELAIFSLTTDGIVWPDRTSAALDLGLTPKRLEKLIAAGAPAEPHSPIPCVPLLRWLVDHYRETGGDGGRSGQMDDDPAWVKAQEDVRWRKLKNDMLEETMQSAARSVALDAITTVMRELKQALLFRVPDDIIDAIHESPPHESTAAVRRTIAAALTETAETAGKLLGADIALDDAEDPA